MASSAILCLPRFFDYCLAVSNGNIALRNLITTSSFIIMAFEVVNSSQGLLEVALFVIDNSRHLHNSLKESSCPICCFEFAIGDTVITMPCCQKPVDPICFQRWNDKSGSMNPDDPELIRCIYCRSVVCAATDSNLYASEISGQSSDRTPYQQSAHRHREGSKAISKALSQLERNMPTHQDIFDKSSRIDWPLILPDRIQKLRDHFSGLYRNDSTVLDATLLDRRKYPSRLPNSSDLVNLVNESAVHAKDAISDTIIFRVEQTSLAGYHRRSDDSTIIRSSRSILFVCAHPQQTIQELETKFVKLRFGADLQRHQYVDRSADPIINQMDFSQCLSLFLVQIDGEFYRISHNATFEGAGVTDGTHLYLAEEVGGNFRMNIEWQMVWTQLIENLGHDLLEQKARKEVRNEIFDLIQTKLALYKLQKGTIERLTNKPGMLIALNYYKEQSSKVFREMMELKNALDDQEYLAPADLNAKIREMTKTGLAG